MKIEYKWDKDFNENNILISSQFAFQFNLKVIFRKSLEMMWNSFVNPYLHQLEEWINCIWMIKKNKYI